MKLTTVVSLLIPTFATLTSALPPPSAAIPVTEKEARSSYLTQALSAKYFHEPAPHTKGSDPLLGHYDSRFFHAKLPYDQKRSVQLHMMRAYLQTFHKVGIETWIAHGTLLGWWWNGAMLPWDWDIDTQVSEKTLVEMGAKMNGTRYDVELDIDGKNITNTYLLDVNPASIERVRGNGLNIIDARWINVHNGMYVDITALSEVDSQNSPGIVSCKNGHQYARQEIWPLRETEFEGEKTKVPYEYTRLLTEEYGDKALVLTEFEGHRWSAGDRAWVKEEVFA